MSISVANEVHIFAVAFLYGVLCGTVFDVFRALRLKIRSGTAVVAVEDIAFWLSFSVMVFSCIYRFNNGQPRWFIFAGIFLGAILYRLTVSRWVVLIFKRILDFFCFLFKILFRIISFPFRLLRRPLRILVIPLSKMNKKVRLVLCKVKNDLKKTGIMSKMY